MHAHLTKRVKIPKDLKDKSTKIEDVRQWARNELGGLDSNLTESVINEIRHGKIDEISLKPRKNGFFNESGKFVETTDVRLDDDLVKAESKSKQEEDDWKWADEENGKFTKRVVREHGMIELWQHGKRMHEFAQLRNYKLRKVYNLLLERGVQGRQPDNTYGLRCHEMSSKFYSWKPMATNEDSSFSLSWEILDAVIRFSHDNTVRDHALALAVYLAPNYKWHNIASFYRGKNLKDKIWMNHGDELEILREKLRTGDVLSKDEIQKLESAI